MQIKNINMSRLNENIEYSEEWLLKNIIKTDLKEKRSGQVEYIKIKKIDLLKLVLKFVKLNKRGG